MKKKIIASALMIGAGVLVALPVNAVQCPTGSKNYPSKKDTLAECNLVEDTSLMPTVNNLITVASGVLGLVAVVVIILGGIQFLTAAGDPSKVKKAKDTILYGVIGLAIAILAWAIVNFVIASIEGAKA